MSDNPAFDRIKSETSESDVVLFMKGTPMFPQCGFFRRRGRRAFPDAGQVQGHQRP